MQDYLCSLSKKETFLTENDFSVLLKYELMKNTPESLCAFSDMSMDLAKRIYRHLNTFKNFTQFTEQLKTKELTYTRISRTLLHVLLNIPSDLPAASPMYVRLLGFKKEVLLFSVLYKITVLFQSLQKPLIIKNCCQKKLISHLKRIYLLLISTKQ